MTKDEFVALCRELLELGAEQVSVDGAGGFQVTFRAPHPAAPARKEELPHGPPKPRSADEERRAFYARLMGDSGKE